MNLIAIIKRIFDDPTDPVRHCEVYKSEGCAHVDGFLCDMATCEIRASRLGPEVPDAKEQ